MPLTTGRNPRPSRINPRNIGTVRVISGKFRSRRLKGTPPSGIRPTSDKLKETIFNILGPSIQNSTFLDGCAGLGGIGIEAISRGAAFVYFVEQSRKACQIIRENLKSLKVDEGYKIIEMDLLKALDTIDRPLDITFVDPPYEREDLYDACLKRFGSSPLLAPDGLLIFEHSKRKELPNASGTLRRIRSLVQGDAALAFYRAWGDRLMPDPGGREGEAQAR
jgi:16S rRNA (guanine966-N2)-methyltransferase